MDEFLKTHNGGDQAANILPPHDLINGTNLFPPLNYLRNSSTPNDISLFPNTDDLVKKVEELVKCNERNGFGDLIETNKGPDSELSMGAPYPNYLASIDRTSCSTNVINGDAICDKLDKIQGENEKQILSDTDAGTADAMYDTANATKTTDEASPAIRSSDDVNGFCDPKEKRSVHTEAFTSSGCQQPLEQNAQNYHSIDHDDNNDDFDANNMDAKHDDSDLRDGASTSIDCEASSSTAQLKAQTKNCPRKKLSANTRTKGKTKVSRHSTKNANNSKPSNNKTNSIIDGSKTKKAFKEPVVTFRGPYVHVSNDGSANVINTPLNEEASDKQKNSNRNFEILAASERNKLRGLHVSTLSNKYDAETRDTSWVCVFCKLGPHKYGLGDLFGPFIMSTESDDYFAAMIEARVESPTKKTTSKSGKKVSPKGLAVAGTSKDADVRRTELSILIIREFT